MSEDPGSSVKKPMEPYSLLEAIFIFIGSLLFKAVEYLSAFTHIFPKSFTPSKSLSDMPVDVISLIIERLDYKEQLRLRKVSKSLRSFVDSQKPACKSIQVNCSIEGVDIKMNEVSVAYTSHVDCNASIRYDDLYEIVIMRDDYSQIAFDDLASTLKNPRLQLDKFSFDFGVCDDEDILTYYNNLLCILEPLNHQLSVKKLKLGVLNPSTLLSILPCLKPGYLENISLYLEYGMRANKVDWRIDSTGMDKVALLEQWKQAEELELQYCFDEFPLEYATNFKRFRILSKLDDKRLACIKDFLSKLDNFERCTLSYDRYFYRPNSVYEVLGVPVSRNTKKEVFHHPITGSDYYFEFIKPKKACRVEIVKKKREVN